MSDSAWSFKAVIERAALFFWERSAGEISNPRNSSLAAKCIFRICKEDNGSEVISDLIFLKNNITLIIKEVSRKDAKKAKAQRNLLLCAFAFFAPLRETITYLSSKSVS